VVVVVLVLVVVVGPVTGTAAFSFPVIFTGGLASGLEQAPAPKEIATAINTGGTNLRACTMAPTLLRTRRDEQT